MEHKAYKDFSAEDFAADDYFFKWVKKPDPETHWFWEAFLERYPHKATEVDAAKKIIGLLQRQEHSLGEDDISAMRRQIVLHIHNEKNMADENVQRHTKKNTKPATMRWLGWAAFIGIPLSILASVYFLHDRPDIANIAMTTQDAAAEKRINPKGQKSVLHLPDGTKVWLNADSRLNFSKAFATGKMREVYLEGEAYFDVVKNPDKPFVVRTSAISIQVLGTAFNVKSYHDDGTIETTLVHGKVSIHKAGTDGDDKSLILKPNQRAVFNKASNTMNVDQVRADKATSWRFDKLVFDETPFYDVVAQLERWYDVKIHTRQDGDLTCRLTAEIENEKLEDVLALLAISHKIHYTIAGKEVFIEGALCK